MKRNWLEELSEKMQNHEQIPPSEIWQDLENELFDPNSSQGVPIPVGGRPNNRGIFRGFQNYGIAASLVGLLLGGALVYWALKEDSFVGDQNPIVMQKPHKVQESGTMSSIESPDMQNSHGLKTVGRNSATAVQGTQPFKRTDNALSLTAQELISSVVDYSQTWSVPPLSSLEVFGREPQQKHAFIDSQVYPLKIVKAPPAVKVASRLFEKLSFGPIAGQLASNSSAQDPGYLTLSGGNAARTVLQQLDAPYSNVVMGNSNQEASTEVRHQTPISYGIAVQYPLNSKWSLSSGISYTNLRSDLKAGTELNYWESRQNIHYLGVPLHVNYRLSEHSKLSTYAYAGGEVKKVIAANTKTNYVVKNEPITYTREKISERPVQVSLNSGIGLEYRLHKNISLYVEPGLEYHLNDNSSIHTLYKDRPLTFSLRSGLRISVSKQ